MLFLFSKAGVLYAASIMYDNAMIIERDGVGSNFGGSGNSLGIIIRAFGGV